MKSYDILDKDKLIYIILMQKANNMFFTFQYYLIHYVAHVNTCTAINSSIHKQKKCHISKTQVKFNWTLL